jgi:site-specific DNA recombinase
MVLALAYEEELRLANISIYVSDEAGEPGRPTSVLTRRIKQAVGEWYVLELVEESRRGMEENTRQGFNTGGVAPHGYRKRLLPHPARSMADRGKHKVVLEPDRSKGLSSSASSGSSSVKGASAQSPSDLNRDGIPSARGGPWSGAAVSGILDNPKYTGFQVWNRRRRKTSGNRTNAETEWVWSETPAHPAIISIGLWKAAQGMRRRPETDWRRRPKSGMPAKPLRGMVFCSCSRRMAAVQRARRTKESVW